MLARCSLHSRHFVALEKESVNTCLEVDFAATFDNLIAHILYHARQLVRTNVWMCIDKNIGRGSKLAENAENLIGVASFLAARIEFPVRISPCATFSKGVVALGIYFVLARDEGNIFAPFANIFSALEHHGAQSELDEAQGGKESTRTCAHHNDALGVGNILIRHLLIIESWRLFIDVYIERKIHENGTLARIDAPLANVNGLDSAPIASEFASHIFTQHAGLKSYIGRYA